jgi:serine/threonine-protein kinase RsbW
MSLTIHAGEAPLAGVCVFDRTMASRLDRKEELINAASEFIKTNAWIKEQDLHWLTLCFDEVVVNAMLHGNEGDPTLPVRLRIFDDGDAWVVLMDDEGTGFEAADVPHPDDNPDAIMLEHGRGILIMREWLDEIVYYRNGATACMRRFKES